MKTINLILLFLITLTSNSQVVDYKNFDNKLLEKLVFEEINKYRDSLGVDRVMWSNVMYNYVTTKQTKIVSKGDRLFHPNLDLVATDEFKILVSKESEKLTGIKSFNSGTADSFYNLTEIGGLISVRNITYQQLAKLIVGLWDGSYLHKCIMKGKYTKDGCKGLCSVSAVLNYNKTNIIIFTNFTTVIKDKKMTRIN